MYNGYNFEIDAGQDGPILADIFEIARRSSDKGCEYELII